MLERYAPDTPRRPWPWTSFVVGGIVVVAAAPIVAVLFALTHLWCRDHGWPPAAEASLALASLALLGWWWCGMRRQREWIATFAQPLRSDEVLRLLPTLPEVQLRMGCPRQLEVWLLPRRATNAFVLGNRHLVITAGLAGEPPDRQSAVIAHELAHLRLGHALTCWLLERCLFGYEHAMMQTTRSELNSRVVPGSLVTAVLYVLFFSVLAVPLLILRVAGVALGRQMEWQADRLAARNGYGDSLDAVLGAFASEDPQPVGVYMLRAHARTHPLRVERRNALRTGRVRRTKLLAALRRAVAGAIRSLAHGLRSVTRALLTPPIDCGTIFVSWCFADLGALQTMMGGAFVGLPSLLLLATITFRGRPRRPIKRSRTLRLGLLLIFATHLAFIVDPPLWRHETAAGLFDLAWLIGAASIGFGVGIRAWLKAFARGAALLLLPGRYAQRLLRPPSEPSRRA